MNYQNYFRTLPANLFDSADGSVSHSTFDNLHR